MKAKETIVQSLVQKAAQAIIKRESEGWPPDSLWSAFQPHSIARKTKISDKVTINDFFAPAASSMRWALFLYYIAFLLIPYVSTYVDLRFGFAILMKAKTKRRCHL